MAGKLIRLHPANFALTGESARNDDMPSNPANPPAQATPPYVSLRPSGPSDPPDGPDAEVVRLAPVVEEIPNLPGGPALKAAARWVGGAGRLLALRRA